MMRVRYGDLRALLQCLGLAAVLGNRTIQASAQADLYKEYPNLRGQEQPLVWRSLPPWMTLSMQLRGRTEGNTDLKDDAGNDRVYELTRVYGALTVRPASFLKGYLQFIDTHALGLPLDQVASNMRDTFDLRQGYLQFHRDGVTLTAGRKEMQFGDERVVGISDFTNNSRTFDGFYGKFGKTDTLDVFSSSVVTVHPTSLDTHGAGLTFHGAWGTINSFTPRARVQPFVLVKAMPRVRGSNGVYGTETEVTFGSEVDGRFGKNLYYDLLGDLQRGSYAQDSLHAGSGLAKVAYAVPALHWTPRFGGEWDYASGETKRLPGRRNTFDQQYPSNHNAFGLQDFFAFQNITEARVNIDLEPSRKLSMLVQEEFLHLANTHDAIYSSGGDVFLAAPVGGFTSDALGRGFDWSAKYLITSYLVMNSGIDYFTPGNALRSIGHTAHPIYAYLSLTYRFKVDHTAGTSPSQEDAK